MIKISPSILNADFSDLKNEILKLKNAGADMLHIDVMDGSFVPNISIGMPVIKSIRKISDIVFDVHLMIDKPERYINNFIDSGADIITFHIESTQIAPEIIKQIKSMNKKVGIAVKPSTAIKEIYPFLNELDLVLIMTVEPGFGGQSYINEMDNKIISLKNEIISRKINTLISIDGGVKLSNIKEKKELGIDIAVAGSEIFETEDLAETINQLKI